MVKNVFFCEIKPKLWLDNKKWVILNSFHDFFIHIRYENKNNKHALLQYVIKFEKQVFFAKDQSISV